MLYLCGFQPDIAPSYHRYLSRFSNDIAICDTAPNVPLTANDVLIIDADTLGHSYGAFTQSATPILAIGTQPHSTHPDSTIRHFTKPINLSAIGQAILELSMPELDTLLPVTDGWQLTMPRKILIHPQTGRNLILTDKEGELLAALLNASPNTVGKDHLLQQIWGYDERVDTHTLETHIYRLRTKLSDILSQEKGLITYADGYGFLR